MIQEPRRR